MVTAERRGLKGHWGPRAAWRLCWRGAVVLWSIASGIAELVLRRPKTRAERARWLQRMCRRALRLLGIVTTVEGEFPATGAVITNHQGYLDVLVLASLAPCVFVAKAEIARWPVMGWMTTMAGTVYVRRGRGGSAAAARDVLREAAKDGLPVVLFPEGTTSDGAGLLPFHGGMLAEARAAGMAVTAGVLRYAIDGPPGATVGDEVAYWGDRGMLEHIARFLTLEGVRVRARFASEPIAFQSADRKVAAVEARAAVLQLMRGDAPG